MVPDGVGPAVMSPASKAATQRTDSRERERTFQPI